MSVRAILLSASVLAALLVLDGLDVLGTVVTAGSILLGLSLSMLFLSSALDSPQDRE